MPDKSTIPESSRMFDDALLFAVRAHSGMIRKKDTLYILHPMEAAVIAGTITTDPEVLSAAVLHDTVEDTPVTIEEIRKQFGARVAALVASETEDKLADLPPSESWQLRKQTSLEVLKNAEDIGTKIMWLSDKLSNIRSFVRMHRAEGDAFWNHFNQRDPAKQAWYYRCVAAYTAELSDTDAWQEFTDLIEQIFKGDYQNG